jgi:hypothetical protein
MHGSPRDRGACDIKKTFSICRQMILHSHHRSVRPCRFRTANLA